MLALIGVLCLSLREFYVVLCFIYPFSLFFFSLLFVYLSLGSPFFVGYLLSATFAPQA